MAKRAAPQEEGTLIKRARSSEPEANQQQLAISSSNDERQKALIRSVKRTSNLEAPIVSLSGAHGVSLQVQHLPSTQRDAFLQAEILSCRFDPTGQNIAACSADRGICASLPSFLHLYLPHFSALWRTYPPNTNYGLLSTLHKAPVLDLQWSLFSPLLYSVSADHTLAYTDLTTGQRIRKLRAHREIINSLDRTLAGGAGVELLASASDDGTVRVWEGGDDAGKEPVAVFELGCPVTCVAWSADGASIYAGALDNVIHVRILFVCLDVVPITYSGFRFTEAGRGIRAEWPRRYPHWSCSIT